VVLVPKETSSETGILLLNCKSCDDILRLDEDHPRPCLCGASSARFVQKNWMLSGPARLMRISFEDYDGAIPGLALTWELL
jgi:hypothetical protein